MINVSNIEKFATHDGPGIRTTVFLKGCPLHCPWCANPETWTTKPVLMHDTRKCVGCQACQKACVNQAITFDPTFKWNPNTCQNCSACVSSCLHSALEFNGTSMEIDEIVSEVLKDRDYYEMSGGGVTISGGEPFVQFDQFLKLIKEFKKQGLHVAVETTGNYPLDYLMQAEPFIDLFLMDIKHIDADKLFHVTGANLDKIINNLDYLSNHCPKKVIIRTPIIPEFNYDPDTLTKILSLAKDKGIDEVNLLPYHSLGKSKWDKMHKDYAYSNLKMMDKKVLMEYTDIGKSMNLKVKIGG